MPVYQSFVYVLENMLIFILVYAAARSCRLIILPKFMRKVQESYFAFG